MTLCEIAHRLSTVRATDRIVTLERGRLVEDGTHDALIKTGGRYASCIDCRQEFMKSTESATRHPHATRRPVAACARAARRRACIPAGRA